jgi:hypothetical protein
MGQGATVIQDKYLAEKELFHNMTDSFIIDICLETLQKVFHKQASIKKSSIFYKNFELFIDKRQKDNIKYLRMLLETFECTKETVICAVINIITLSNKYSLQYFTEETFLRLFLTSLICASKFTNDAVYPNKEYAYMTSLPLQEINAMEIAFLKMMNFDVFVGEETFFEVFRTLIIENPIFGTYNDNTLIPETASLIYRKCSEHIPQCEAVA